MMKNYIFLISLVLISCNQKSKIEKISINYIGCLGECPQIKVEINSNHQIKYFGGYFSKKRGFYNGKIDRKTWNKIEDFLSNGNYLNLEDSYYLSSDEEMDIELVINSEIANKRVKGLIVHFPPEIKKMLEFVLKDVTNWELKPINKKLDFDFFSDKPIKPKFPPPIN